MSLQRSFKGLISLVVRVPVSLTCAPGDLALSGLRTERRPHMELANVLPLSYVPSPAPAFLTLWVRKMGPREVVK